MTIASYTISVDRASPVLKRGDQVIAHICDATVIDVARIVLAAHGHSIDAPDLEENQREVFTDLLAEAMVSTGGSNAA